MYAINGGTPQTAGSTVNMGIATFNIPAPDAGTIIVTKLTNADGCQAVTDQEAPITLLSAPGITACPSLPVVVGTATGLCSATAAYSVAASGDPTPGFTYSFSGVTSGTGSGTGSGSAFNKGNTSVTVTATNTCGASICSFTVSVVDKELPDITCPNAVLVVCASQIPAVNLASVTASDNCGGATKTYVGDATTNQTCANRRTVTRTYRATDSVGNSSTCAQIITVFDDVKPNFTSVPANVLVQCNSIPAVGTATATDGCGGSVTVVYNGQSVTNVLCTDKYTLVRQWTATDACGNTKTATQSITVTDTQKPNFTTTPANVTVQCDAIPAVATPTATDNCDTAVAVTYNGQTQTNGACANAYTLTRTWTAADNCGNTKTVTQRITVVDTGKPAFTAFPANTSIACHENPPAVGSPTASDGCSSNVTITYLGQGSTSGNCPGNYQLKRTWRATDACGNSTVATQTIQVTDTDEPEFVSIPADVTIQCGQSLPPLVLPTASDACGYAFVTYLGQVASGSGCAADYTVTRNWEAEDLCGNTASVSQVITVQGNNNAEEEGAENRAPATLNSKFKIQNSKFKSLNVQPNPTTDRVWIDLSDFVGEAVTVSIFSDLGQLIWERSIPAVEEQKLPVSLREIGAASGIYTVGVRGSGGVVAKRVVLVE